MTARRSHIPRRRWRESRTAAVLLVLISIGAIALAKNTLLEAPLRPHADDYPWAFLPEGHSGTALDAVLIRRAAICPRVPFAHEGKQYWRACRCLNRACPGRQDGKDYLFPMVESDGQGEVCPLCLARHRTKRTDRGRRKYDPLNVASVCGEDVLAQRARHADP